MNVKILFSWISNRMRLLTSDSANLFVLNKNSSKTFIFSDFFSLTNLQGLLKQNKVWVIFQSWCSICFSIIIFHCNYFCLITVRKKHRLYSGKLDQLTEHLCPVFLQQWNVLQIFILIFLNFNKKVIDFMLAYT